MKTLHGTRVALEETPDGIRLILPPSGWISPGCGILLGGLIFAVVPLRASPDWVGGLLALPGFALALYGLRQSRRFVVLQVTAELLILIDGRPRSWPRRDVDRLLCRESASVSGPQNVGAVRLWLRLKDGRETRLIRGYDALSLKHAATFVNKALGT